jgi:hypothetical protein
VGPSRDAIEGQTGKSVVAKTAAPSAAAPSLSFVSAGRPDSAALLALQRCAGNAATLTALRHVAERPRGDVQRRDRERVLARCNGTCGCGGRCRSEAAVEDGELESRARRLLSRAASVDRLATLLSRAVADRRQNGA